MLYTIFIILIKDHIYYLYLSTLEQHLDFSADNLTYPRPTRITPIPLEIVHSNPFKLSLTILIPKNVYKNADCTMK